MGIPLPALSIRPPENPLDQYAKALSVKSMIGGQQLQQQEIQRSGLQNQLLQQEVKDKQIISDSYKKNKGDLDKTFNDAADQGASPASLINLHTLILGQKEKEASLTKTQLENMQTQNDAILQAHDSVAALPEADRPAAYKTSLNSLAMVPGLDVSKFPQEYDPKNFDAIGANLAGTSARLAAQARMKTAGKVPEGEQPLAKNMVSQLNDGMTLRFQQMNPGMPLPSAFKLPDNATQKDADRIEKIMQQTEQSQATKLNHKDAQAQLKLSNSIREQTLQLAKDSAADRDQKLGNEPVVGQDASGNTVLVSTADAKKMGLTGTMKADTDLVNKSQAARDWLKLADKPGTEKDTPPDKMGITQLINRLDSEGKLGAIASRWNEFVTGKVGVGDAEYNALRAKMGLSTTKLMQAHVGSRGGAFLLEHFEDLANAKKMNGEALRSGVLSEMDYMKDVAKLPAQQGGGGASAFTVNVPGKGPVSFPTQAALDNFKKEAGIK
jgi:hypothetical protein